MIEVDLDKDNKKEYIVISSIDYNGYEVKDKKVAASSVQILDNNYKLINNLVTFYDTASSMEEKDKVLISTNDVEIIDVDNDGKTEILVEIPGYECEYLSIYKYENNKIQGEKNLVKDLEP